MADDLAQVKKCLRSVLISCPEGTPLNNVESDYRSFLGIPLNYRQFGHKSIDSFLRSIPDTARLQGNIVYGVSCDEIKHVTKLISNQRQAQSNVKRVSKARQKARVQMQPNPVHTTYRQGPSHGNNKFSWGGPNRVGAPVHQPFSPMPYGPPVPPYMGHGPPGLHRMPPHPPPPQPPPPPQFYPQMPPNLPPGPPPEDELIFSDDEIYELLSKENIPYSSSLSHILSLAFPYIYRGSHMTILDLNQSLCYQIATAIALDCEEELDGFPAVIVCKMENCRDLSVLESSSRVECFRDIASFPKTRAKVITAKFSELFIIMDPNNDHFYNETTFIIFVDVSPSQMHILSDMLPSQFQYLFLSTCCDRKENSKSLYRKSHIVIAKEAGHYRDFANNGERLIEQLARKLAILNYRHPPQNPMINPLPSKGAQKPHNKVPQQSFVASQPPRVVQPQPHSLPSQPYNMPLQPNDIPLQHNRMPTQHAKIPSQTSKVPSQPNNMPQHANNMPQHPNNMPQHANNMPQHPNNMPQQTNNMPQQTNNMPSQPNNMPQQTNNMPSQPNNMPQQTNNMPSQPNNMPLQPNNMHSQPNNMPSQPNNMHSQPNNMPSQPNNMPSQPNNMPSQPNEIHSQHDLPSQIDNLTLKSNDVPSEPQQPTPLIDNDTQPQVQENPDDNIDGATSCEKSATKEYFPALKHLTESAFKASVNLLIQAEKNKGKTTLLLEFAISKIDTTIDKLQIVLTTPSPKSSSGLFLKLRELVNLNENTNIRAFGYSEGNLDKLNVYLIEQKVHILVMDNPHFFSLVSKAPGITSHCKMIGCDELYGSHYTKQVPAFIKPFLEKVNNSNVQFVVMTHPNENEILIHDLFPKPYWHIRQEEESKKRDKYSVSFLHQ